MLQQWREFMIARIQSVMKIWSNDNRMPLNIEKTCEMIVRAKVTTLLPEYIPSIKRNVWLKLLGVTMEEIPRKWDRHFEKMMNKASKRMYILRVCKQCGLITEQLDLVLFNCVIVYLFGHGFIAYPKGRNVERAQGPSCPCVLCIPIHIITINIESFLGYHISHSLGLYLLHQI